MTSWRLSILAAGLVCPALACTPLVRYGDIEPPKGHVALVDVVVTPVGRDVPEDVFLATGHGAMRRFLVGSAPRVSADVVVGELASKVQGSDVAAVDASVDETELATDAQRIEAIYAARGYFDAHLVDSRLVALGNHTARLEIYVEEGEATTVREVVFAGFVKDPDDVEMNERLAEIERDLPELVPLSPGDVWEEDLYLQSLARIQATLRARGFVHATVTGENIVSRDKGLAAVRFDIDHGPLVYASGTPIITGNEHVSDARIRRRVVVRKGDVIEAEALRDTEERVEGLGAFLAVQARAVRTTGELATKTSESRPEEPGPDEPPDSPADGVLETGGEPPLPRELPVEVKITEAPLWDMAIGPAAVTDSTKLELALPIAFTHRAIVGEVVALRASVKPALVFPEFWTSSEDSKSVQFGLLGKLSLDVPSFFEELLRLSIGASYELDPNEPRKEELGARIGFSRPLGSGFRLAFGYDLSQIFYFDDSPLSALSTADALGISNFRFRDNDRVTWLGASLIYDRRDGVYDARRGAYGQLAIDGGHPALGSTIEFFRISAELRGYVTPSALPWFTFALRGKAGMTFFPESQGTPESIRFESGGPNAHRGFSAERMGDYVCTSSPATGLIGSDFTSSDPACSRDPADRIYIGGNYVFEVNAELRAQPGPVGFVFFVDAGRLWSRFAKIDFKDLFVAVGPGLRLETPVGPVRFDLGLLLGRQRARVVHFSLGQAF